jgi:uncharacterized repeat protein (TIGR01451 family)
MVARWTGRIAAFGLLITSVVVGQAGVAQADDPGPPSGNGIQPEFVDGNPTCAELAPDDAEWFELKVEPVVDGTYSDGTLEVTIDVNDTVNGPTVDWTSNIGVDAVFVKGSSDGNLYTYDPPAESTGDTALHAALQDNGKFAGLSHLSFCYDVRASVSVDKGGDQLGKIGDPAHYIFTITNDGDVPITRDGVTDTLLGDLNDEASAGDCDTLAAGASCIFTVDRTVLGTDPDPLPNTVTVNYTGTLPDESTDEVEATDDHEVNLFQPSVTIDKTGEALSNVGDEVTYTFLITNTSSSDSPDLMLDSVTDDVIGDLGIYAAGANCGQLAPSATCTFDVPYTIQEGDADPLVNTVGAHYHPDGFPNDISAGDDHSLELFQPSVTIDKTGTTLSKVGDPVDYTITVTNTSSSDSPDLSCTIADPFLGISEPVTLAPGGNHVITPGYTVQAGDPDPLINEATVDCTVAGFANVVLSESDTHEVNLFQPAVTIVKDGPAQASVGDTVTYAFTITNSGSSDSPALVLASVNDTVLGDLTGAASGAGCGSLAAGASCNFTVDYAIPDGAPNPLVNVVDVLYNPDGFPNEIRDDDDHSVELVTRAEGCTPGFWKNHPAQWPVTGFSTGQTLESVFDVPNNYGLDNNTLLQALSFQGGNNTTGAARNLLRASVAAVLNSAHPDVEYPRSTADVISAVNAALASGNRATMLGLASQLDADNNLGCPLS